MPSGVNSSGSWLFPIIAWGFCRRAQVSYYNSQMIRLLSTLVATLLLPAPALGQAPPINLPPGFTLSVFASGLGGARFMTLDPSGTLLVSVSGRGRVVALPENNARGTAEAITVVEGLDLP